MIANYLKTMLKRRTRQIRGQLEHIISLDNIIMSVGSKASLLSNNYIYIYMIDTLIYTFINFLFQLAIYD